MHRDEHQHGHLQEVIDGKRLPHQSQERVEAREDRQREQCGGGIGPCLDRQQRDEQREGGDEQRDVERLVGREVVPAGQVEEQLRLRDPQRPEVCSLADRRGE